MSDIIFEVRIKGPDPKRELIMKNPVMTASGTFGFGREYSRLYDLNRLGAITVKGITIEPRRGNPPPRLIETPSGILNSIGLQNPGLEGFIGDELPYLRRLSTPVIVNISGNTIEEYAFLASELDRVEGVSALEVNVSCPNVKEGCMAFGIKKDSLFSVVSAVRKSTTLPVIVKLSPNVRDIAEMAETAENAGADAVSLVNTFLGMAIDIDRKKPLLANTFGGLSGPAIKPIALRMVWEVYERVDIPVIGMGGIMNWKDAVEFILAGAASVAVGTANFVNPTAPLEIIDGIENYMIREGINDIRELIGLGHRLPA
ncbi:Dihydroorotate dehydrogenase B (NAD(+)), catalytic subunit [Koleobacter methoxysyntrophicus]|uniref:Dihydroorotate dehydrogenase n=1 Tax=Koleobacter methoxysyntrophicus TaxID=2751313 RepID=A0A8A0RME4_9FIRM|nr:dihydroorotate dehydrogenase [Koleobacter methoxysyntrophicus]QSQ08768.1 Dihydroorotate dehydrogenase B (NAD(+)), catalytic subunit [Koleobacter methoxysyntrophicus]